MVSELLLSALPPTPFLSDSESPSYSLFPFLPLNLGLVMIPASLPWHSLENASHRTVALEAFNLEPRLQHIFSLLGRGVYKRKAMGIYSVSHVLGAYGNKPGIIRRAS